MSLFSFLYDGAVCKLFICPGRTELGAGLPGECAHLGCTKHSPVRVLCYKMAHEIEKMENMLTLKLASRRFVCTDESEADEPVPVFHVSHYAVLGEPDSSEVRHSNFGATAVLCGHKDALARVRMPSGWISPEDTTAVVALGRADLLVYDGKTCANELHAVNWCTPLAQLAARHGHVNVLQWADSNELLTATDARFGLREAAHWPMDKQAPAIAFLKQWLERKNLLAAFVKDACPHLRAALEACAELEAC